MNRTIRSSAREIIYRVYRRCLLEYEAKTILSDLNNVYKRTAEMTGKSESTLRRVVLEGHRNNGIFSTPGKQRRGRPKKNLDDFDLCAIRQKIQFFYRVRKRAPILRNLIPILREDLGYNGSHEHIKKAAERAFEGITESDWRKSCEHVVEIEKAYYQRELTLYQDIEQVVINLEDSSNTTSDSEFEEENMEQDLNEGTDFEAAGCSHENMGVEGVEYLEEEFL